MLANELKKHGKPRPKPPVWRGPEVDGITFSLLSRFISCRERFRILVMEGLKPKDAFNHRIEYGSMWHVCEEVWAATRSLPRVHEALVAYTAGLSRRYPISREEIDKWFNLCRAEFLHYVDYWAARPEHRQPLLSEYVFAVDYKLPSNRVVKLRGKWDSVDVVYGKCTCGADRTGPSAEAHSEHCPANFGRVWLQENKTKGDIYEPQIRRQLSFDLQTMMYLVALYRADLEKIGLSEKVMPTGIAGVRYNVVRRPTSGGKGDLRLGKNESIVSLCQRLEERIKEEPGNWFMRWNVEVLPVDVYRFELECLVPLLEQLCDWWNYIQRVPNNPWAENPIHWRHPYGVYNPMDEGRASELDEYLLTGSKIGLERTEDLFPELALSETKEGSPNVPTNQGSDRKRPTTSH